MNNINYITCEKLIKRLNEQDYFFCSKCIIIENKYNCNNQYISCSKCNKGPFCVPCVRDSNDGIFGYFPEDDEYIWICRDCECI